MRLQTVSLRGRRFLIQYNEIIREFGLVIPWLQGLDELRFATNGEYFCETLARATHNQPTGVTPYQLVEDERARSFVGGILHFERSPEQFIDRRNCVIAEQLVAEGSSFISCLQVRTPHQGLGNGRDLARRSLDAIQQTKGPVWGVVSNHQLIPWYRSLGASTPSPLQNQDGLWIIHWPKATPP